MDGVVTKETIRTIQLVAARLLITFPPFSLILIKRHPLSLAALFTGELLTLIYRDIISVQIFIQAYFTKQYQMVQEAGIPVLKHYLQTELELPILAKRRMAKHMQFH